MQDVVARWPDSDSAKYSLAAVTAALGNDADAYELLKKIQAPDLRFRALSAGQFSRLRTYTWSQPWFDEIRKEKLIASDKK